MKSWKNEDELFDLIRRELYTAVIGDILDTLNLVHQFLPSNIRPLDNRMKIAGRAMTVLESDIHQEMDERILNKPFGVMLEALDDLKKNEVYICTGASPEYALWGELMATRAKHIGAVGAVVDGYSRDTNGILAMDFPCFSYGGYAQDQAPRGKVVDFRIPIRFKKVLVRPGDIVFGDRDGVCIVPKEIEQEVIAKAMEKVKGERTVKDELQRGMNAMDAFTKYKIM